MSNLKIYAKTIKPEAQEGIRRLAVKNCRDWYWVGDDVGGVCDFGDADFLNAEDMARIVENGMSYDEYAEWRESNLDHARYINLRSWMMGARHGMCATISQ